MLFGSTRIAFISVLLKLVSGGWEAKNEANFSSMAAETEMKNKFYFRFSFYQKHLARADLLILNLIFCRNIEFDFMKALRLFSVSHHFSSVAIQPEPSVLYHCAAKFTMIVINRINESRVCSTTFSLLSLCFNSIKITIGVQTFRENQFLSHTCTRIPWNLRASSVHSSQLD